jgi:diguanylate cyclase (GGDEF)-like protein
MSTELIEYIPTIYSDVLGIEALSRLLFTGILMAYVASIFVLYILNIYLFKSSDYLTIKLSSETDALTGVLNRKAGINFLKERMQNIQLKKGFLTVCFIDVNNLKIVNDEYGHKIGDDLIKNTSNIIKQALREGDEIARLGGDEFLVVFNQCSIEQAVRAWDRIIEKLETFNLRSNAIYDISVSVGFSEYSHKMDIDHETLIELADSEMYKNKERYKRLKGKSKNGKW